MVNWPTTGRDAPKDLREHAAQLKAEFDSVNNAVNASLSRNNLLPSVLESKIEKGIANGILEAHSNGYIFSNVLLKNITTTTALKARDRIPLPQFHGLHESFKELNTKIQPQSSTTSQTRPSVAARVATQPTLATHPVNAAPTNNTDRGLVKAPNATGPTRMEEKAKPVSSEDTDSGTRTDEEEADQNVDARDNQGAIETEDVNSAENPSADGSDSSYAISDSEDGGNSQSDTEEGGIQDIVREDVGSIFQDGKGFKSNFNLNIEQQATVNRLEAMTAAELSACIRSSLQNFIDKHQLSCVQFTNQILLDNGHINLDLQTETDVDLQQLIGSGRWARDFERLVCPPVVTSCKVRMHKVEIKTVRLQNRKEKAATIKSLANANHYIPANDQVKRAWPVIRDIYWPNNSAEGSHFAHRRIPRPRGCQSRSQTWSLLARQTTYV